MSFAKATFNMLNGQSDVTDLVGSRISPYVRNRDDGFPAVVYAISREEIFTDSAAQDLKRIAEVSITCMDRTHMGADELAEEVIAALGPGTHGGVVIGSARPTSIDRDFGDPYDGSQDLVYRTTITATMTGA